MNWLKLIPLVGSVVDLVEKLVNKPSPVPESKDAAKRAADRWFNRGK